MEGAIPVFRRKLDDIQPRTQGFLLPRLVGQRKRPWLRLVCFAT
jgi:hypothetical protein